MSASNLLGESARLAVAARLQAGLVLLLAFAVPLAALGTAGRNIENEAAILGRLDDVGARVITITSIGASSAITRDAVDRLAALTSVAWAVGLGPVVDLHARAPVGGAIPMRTVRAIRAPIAFSEPWSGAGGAFVSQSSAARARLGGAYGVLDPGALSVVGWFAPQPPLQDLGNFAVVPMPGTEPVERVILAVSDVSDVEAVAGQIAGLLGADADGTVAVDLSPELLAAREAVRAEVTRRDRMLVVALLAGSMLLIGVVVLVGSIAARRDFGRRRALGASQVQLIALVILSTFWPSIIGASAGTAAGWAFLAVQIGRVGDWQFPAAVGVLTILTCTAAAAVPAAIAATRDPLDVLRVP